MSNPQKRKGDQAEREVSKILSDLLGVTAVRALGAGRKEDVGDVFGIPDTVIQVANYKDLPTAVRVKLPACEQQRVNAGATFCATFVRRRGGEYVVCMTPEMFATFWREAVAPVATGTAG